jgi:single-strand DNA-binding protein
MSFILTGKLIVKDPVKEVSETYTVRDFVIETLDGNYPQTVKFQLTQDRTGLLDPFKLGSVIEVHFDIRGREYNGNYYNNLNAWRLKDPTVKKAQTAPTAPEEPDIEVEVDDDDLPF